MAHEEVADRVGAVNGLGGPVTHALPPEMGSMDDIRERIDALDSRLRSIEAWQSRFYQEQDGWQRVLGLSHRMDTVEKQLSPQPQPQPPYPYSIARAPEPREGWNLGTQLKQSAGVTIPVSVLLILMEAARTWLTLVP